MRDFIAASPKTVLAKLAQLERSEFKVDLNSGLRRIFLVFYLEFVCKFSALRGRKEGVVLEEGDAPKFVIPLEDWSCSEGSTVEFECKVTGKPTPQLKWYN